MCKILLPVKETSPSKKMELLYARFFFHKFLDFIGGSRLFEDRKLWFAGVRTMPKFLADKAWENDERSIVKTWGQDANPFLSVDEGPRSFELRLRRVGKSGFQLRGR